MKRYIAMCSVICLISVGAVAAQSQKPATSGRDTQHHQMMQGMTDADWVMMTMKHHQHGIEMARLEEQRGESASVKALAAKIRQSQEGDLKELKPHSKHHAKGTSGHADHEKMMEQQGQKTMGRLKSASGSALDHAFLEEMAKHHEMAISMTEGAKLQDPELKKLASKMVAGQRQELGELKKQLSAHAK